jgi:hypothetical protein
VKEPFNTKASPKTDYHSLKAYIGSEPPLDVQAVNAYSTILEQTDQQITELFGLKIVTELPKTREGLKSLYFKCPVCHKTKTGNKLVIVEKPLESKQINDGDKITVTFSLPQLICCSTCANKILRQREGWH